MVIGGPLGRFQDDIIIEIDGSRRSEELFDIFCRTDVRIALLQLAIFRPLILRIIVERGVGALLDPID